jgi:hypothetical protein
MKHLMALAAFLSATAFPISIWTDGNGLMWTMLEVKTTFFRAQERCRELKFDIPGMNDLFEALDYGLANENINTSFGADMKKVDWMWAREKFQVISPLFYIVSRQGDSTPVMADERHWGLCVQKPKQ